MIADAVNAVRLRMGWDGARALLGLTAADQGTLVERVLAQVVTEQAVLANNRDVEEAKRG